MNLFHSILQPLIAALYLKLMERIKVFITINQNKLINLNIKEITRPTYLLGIMNFKSNNKKFIQKKLCLPEINKNLNLQLEGQTIIGIHLIIIKIKFKILCLILQFLRNLDHNLKVPKYM